jgi:hypothetical protein
LIPEKIYASSESMESLDSESDGSESKSVNKGNLENNEMVLDCKYTVHRHTKECYDDKHNIICGYADYVVHTHDKNCYDSKGKLVCKLEEIEEHTHGEECYGEVEKETQAPEDSESGGTDEEGVGDMIIIMDEPIPLKEDHLICQKEEIQLHTHTMICLDYEGNIECGKLEVLSHQHTEACFKTVKKSTTNVKKTTSPAKQQAPSQTITNITQEDNNSQDIVNPDTEIPKTESEKPFGAFTIIGIIILILAAAIISRCIIYRWKRSIKD